MALGLASGAVSLSLPDVGQGLLDTLVGKSSNQNALIVGQIRLPRVLLAAVMGATLAISGAAMQGLFRNPLADPSLIGVIPIMLPLVIVMGVGPFLSWKRADLPGVFDRLIAVLFVYHLATSPNGTSVATMLLAGIAITALSGAMGSLLEFFADNNMLRRISLWKMGGLDGANYPRLLLATVVGAALMLALPRYAKALNAMLLGESEARHLGIRVDTIKMALITWVAIGVGTSVALVGDYRICGPGGTAHGAHAGGTRSSLPAASVSTGRRPVVGCGRCTGPCTGGAHRTTRRRDHHYCWRTFFHFPVAQTPPVRNAIVNRPDTRTSVYL